MLYCGDNLFHMGLFIVHSSQSLVSYNSANADFLAYELFLGNECAGDFSSLSTHMLLFCPRFVLLATTLSIVMTPVWLFEH